MEELFATFGIDWKLIIAQAVNFGIVLAALTYFLYKPVLKTLDERAKKIAQGVEDAEKARSMREGADAEAAGIVAKADAEASELLSTARESAGAERARLVKEAETRAAAIAADAEARAKEASAKALRESEKEIARLATLAAAKVLKEKA